MTPMNSSTLDSNATPDGATDPQKARPRRRRPARPRDTATTTAATSEQAAATAPTASETPASSAPATETSATGGTPDETQRGRGEGSGRSRRGRGRGEGRKSAVQLIVPPTHAPDSAAPNEEATEHPAASEPVAEETSEATGTTEARVVPVTTAAAPVAETAEASATAEATPARSRYRFAPRSTPVVPAAPVRVERLSSGATTPSAPTVEARPAPTSDDDENWQATVAEVAPADVARSAAEAQNRPPSEEQADDEHAVNDLISALGLHDRPATARGRGAHAAPRVEAVVEPQAEEANETLAEAEAGSTEETPEGEGQNGTRRRRRRRRGSSHAASADELEDEHATDSLAERGATQDEEIEIERDARNGYEPYAPYGTLDQPYSPYTRAPRERTPQVSAWDVSASQQQAAQQAAGQYGQPPSAYGSPEPSFARGFGPQPRGVAGPPREALARPTRSVDAPVTSSQLAQIVSNAIGQQTDRLLTELRRQQQPPSMMLQLPAFPSTERIGVYVDVANLFYSARSMRMSLDFGRMLDFLRANRRLVRAHAYAPTNPDANADQSFLNAVKGMGYRITTKNYKTFSSGAKKADMDLDLCMDIVRIVDAGAVDTIVLVSGDSDFLPLLEYCSDHGVRVEVAAFDDSAAMILRQSCDLFINLSMVDEIRA